VSKSTPVEVDAASGHCLFSFTFVSSFICRINRCGNLSPSVAIIYMTIACGRAPRSERHPITFGGPVVVPSGL
jgi:hypothetical protein